MLTCIQAFPLQARSLKQAKLYHVALGIQVNNVAISTQNNCIHSILSHPTDLTARADTANLRLGLFAFLLLCVVYVNMMNITERCYNDNIATSTW